MNKMEKALFELGEMDALAAQDTPVHRLHPLSKLLVTLGYIVAVVSFDKYALSGLLPLILYPLLVSQLSGVSLLLNLVAVAAAIAAFVTDFIHERKAVVLRARLEEAQAEQDVDELCDYLSQYTTASDSDEARRVADDDAYRRECERAVDAGLDAAVLARELLARHVAGSPEQREHIINTPFKVGGKHIAGATRTQTAHEAYAAMGAPSAADIASDWPVVPQNTHFFDEEVAQSLAEHDKRLRAAQGRDAGGFGHGSDPAGDPIPVQPTAAWS